MTAGGLDLSSYFTPGTKPETTPVFAEPWQAEVFSLAIAAHRKNLFSWTTWVEAFSAYHNSNPMASELDYYQHWLGALEQLLTRDGVVLTSEIETRVEQWRLAYLRTPHGQPVELSRGITPGCSNQSEDHHEEHGGDHHHHAHGNAGLPASHRQPPRPRPLFVSPAV
jgi:nitrile hydratase accessory protein